VAIIAACCNHGGVFAGAVHGDAVEAVTGADPLVAGLVVDRVRRRCPQGRLVETRARQDPAYAVQVERLTGVGGAGQREQFAVQVEAVAEHAERLHRLVRGAREHRLVDHAGGPLDSAVGSGHHDGATVVALDESAADDVGQDHRFGHG
jgi:hypothetical protein